jgi:hypothetical protein
MGKRKTLEKLLKGTLVALAVGVGIWYGYSKFQPMNRGSAVDAKKIVTRGQPQLVMSKFEEKVTKYSTMSIYNSDIKDYTEESQRTIIYPNVLYRFEKREGSAASIFTQRKGSKQPNLRLEEDKRYTIQVDCPLSMEEISMTYLGKKLETRLFHDIKSNKIIAKSEFVPNRGNGKLVVTTEYSNKETDQFVTSVMGLRKK